MKKELLEKLVNKGLECGADYSEIFYEDKKEATISFSSSVVNKCTIDLTKGVGIRLAKEKEIYYADTNDLDEENLISIIDSLNKNFDGVRVVPEVKLNELDNVNKINRELDLEALEKIKEKLYEYDKYARSLDKRVIQVVVTISHSNQYINVASSKTNLTEDTRVRSGIYFRVIVKENARSESSNFNIGFSKGFDFVDDKTMLKGIKEAVEAACAKLSAKSAPGGEMPVVIGNGFGGVLIHEACGHAMEATTVAENVSVLSDKLNKKIASSKVTIIDDGTKEEFWGTTKYDDEGNKTRKNILIENGILKKYLEDELNARIMNHEVSGSGRRENFKYIPTSRMNNTYLAPGNDSIEDMISSIKYGLYAKDMGGGIVNPATGDFNFSVTEAYMIRDGKIAEAVKGASLVGNTLTILEEIEMVGSDLAFGIGTCGSSSGGVPVTVGQPTIKLGKILVGGENND